MPEELNTYFFFITAFFLSIALSFVMNKGLIHIQKKKKISQPIHALGVKAHFKKAGTPSLGGLGIILSSVLIFLTFGFNSLNDKNIQGIIVGLLSFFAIGLIDDLLKLLKSDEKGLSAGIRVALEVTFSILALALFARDDSFRWGINLYPSSRVMMLGFPLILLLIFTIVGTANSGNLMDGLDGLNGGLTLIALSAFLILALLLKEEAIALMIMVVIGGLVGFLILNLPPAKIFMGDGGSLGLGAFLALIAIALDRVILLPIIGLLFVFETMSDIIQVAVYKMTHKRVFLMAPLHHHFEMKNIPEYRIVMSYYLFEIVLAIVVVVLGVLI